MRLKSLFIVLLLAINLPKFGYSQLHTYQNYNHRDGLNMASILCATQTEDGYLWIGSDGGELIRFDGEEFKEIRFEHNDNYHHYRSLFSVSDGILFASEYKGFHKYDYKRKKFLRLDSKAKDLGNSICHLYQDSAYYYVSERAIRIKQRDKEKIVYRSNGSNIEVKQVIRSEDWLFLSTNQGVFLLKDGKFSSIGKALNLSVQNLDSFQYGFLKDGTLSLTTSKGDRWLELELNQKGKVFSAKEFEEQSALRPDEQIVSFSFNKQVDEAAILSSKGQIYRVDNYRFKLIGHNFHEPLYLPQCITVDLNGNYWISSAGKGIYSIRKEPFTRLQMDQAFMRNDIALSYKTQDQRIFISYFSGQTVTADRNFSKGFRSFDFRANCIQEYNGSYFMATTHGIKMHSPEDDLALVDITNDSLNVQNLRVVKGKIYFNIRGEGLYQCTLNGTKQRKVASTPDHIYTSQLSSDAKTIFFGTNQGVWSYEIATNKLKRLKYEGEKVGSYFGTSAKDSYGNNWFTADEGLLLIRKNGQAQSVNVQRWVPSNLYYTLNSDNNGRLLVGTNKGMAILKVNEKGEILEGKNFDGKSGFGGYETHMRSQFQNDASILVGTVEGLFQITTSYFERVRPPIAPVILLKEKNDQSSDDESLLNVRIRVNNARAGSIYYRYRILKVSEEWIELGENSFVMVSNLNSGTYTLEVSASYDGKNFGPSTSHRFEIVLPIWKSKWFAIIIIAVVLLVNILLLIYSRRTDALRAMISKDVEGYIRMTPASLLFATVSVTGSYLAAPSLSSDLSIDLAPTLGLGMILLTLYFFSVSASKNGQDYLFKYFLNIAIGAVTVFFLWEIYNSSLHPFHIISLILVCSVVPYILNRVRHITMYGLLVFMGSMMCFIFVDDPVFSKTNFMVAVIVAIAVLVFNSYLRFDALDKLLFVSGVINKGTFPVIAFNSKGIVTYASENINEFVDISSDRLLDQHIRILNKYVLYENRFEDVDLTEEFDHGKNQLTPMVDGRKRVRWVEWKLQKFSDNVRVIIGQDVSEKVDLQNTYELLVQNVEDLIYTVDIEGNFVFVNDTFIKRTGFTREELIGMEAAIIVDPDHRKEIDEYYRDHFSEKKLSTYRELPIRTKSEELIWLGQNVNTIFAPGSDTYIEGFIALARDITEVREQQFLIKAQQNDITSSISYARSIQVNMLPNTTQLEENFSENFILYRPKEIVSGDFYWIQRVGDRLILVLSDCTGHGVPGAFMTILGINLLKNVVLEARLTDPGQILSELDKRLQDYFQESNEAYSTRDGMDMSVLVFKDGSDELSYACAGSRFLIFNDDGLSMFKGSNEQIGDQKTDEFTGYKSQFTEFSTKDSLYLLTDGFQDQYGGIKDKRYSFRRLLELLEANVNLPMNIQLEMISKELEEWQGRELQTDDISLIGLRK